MRPDDRFTQRQLQPAVNIFDRMAEKRGAAAAAAGGGGAPELAAHGFTCDHGDVYAFTAAVPGLWKNHGTEVGAWVIGA